MCGVPRAELLPSTLFSQTRPPISDFLHLLHKFFRFVSLSASTCADERPNCARRKLHISRVQCGLAHPCKGSCFPSSSVRASGIGRHLSCSGWGTSAGTVAEIKTGTVFCLRSRRARAPSKLYFGVRNAVMRSHVWCSVPRVPLRRKNEGSKLNGKASTDRCRRPLRRHPPRRSLWPHWLCAPLFWVRSSPPVGASSVDDPHV